MRRDIQTIKDVLLELEAASGMIEIVGSPEKIYNVELLIEAGLAVGDVFYDHQGTPFQAQLDKLTWAGHDFVDAAKNDTAWAAVKSYISKSGSWTFEIATQILKTVAAAQAQKFLEGLN